MKATALGPTIERLFEIAIRIPWWGALLSALVAYLLLYPIARLQLPVANGMPDVVTIALGELFVWLAGIGRYLLPLALLAAAAISGFDRWKRSEVRGAVTRDTSGSLLRGLPWRDFELLVSDAFRRRGYEVHAPHTDSLIPGRVLVLSRDGHPFLVDCSDWRSGNAGVTAIRGLHKHMKEGVAMGGFAVTSGRFTPEAKHFAAERKIQLVDGRRLKELVRADPQSTRSHSLPHFRGLTSVLARWGDRISRVCGPSACQARGPALGLRESAHPAPGPGAPAADSSSEEVSIDGENRAAIAERQLAALIRAGNRDGGQTEPSVPEAGRRQIHPCRQRWTLPRIPVRNLADAMGILGALGVLWAIYGWFLQLSAVPEHTPWALLGANSGSGALVRHLQETGRTRSAAEMLEGKRPLGQYRFGPPPGFLGKSERKSQQQEEGPVEVYHSLRELEKAFEAKYVGPPECDAYESNSLLVKCGNHRIRARRSFIDSGGRITPMLLGAWEEESPVPGKKMDPGYWDDDSDGDNRQQEGGGDWNEDPGQNPSLAGEPQWRQNWSHGIREHRAGDWRPQPLPIDQRQSPDTRQHHPIASDEQWRQDWSRDLQEHRASDWRSQPLPEERRHWGKARQDTRRAPDQDWRQDWSQDVQQHRGSGWRSRPPPVERRHWEDTPLGPDREWRQDWSPDVQEQRSGDWRSEPVTVEPRQWADDF